MSAILICNTYSRVNDILLNLSWLSIEQRIYFNAMVFIRKTAPGDIFVRAVGMF